MARMEHLLCFLLAFSAASLATSAVDGMTIEKIRLELSSGTLDVEEGDLGQVADQDADIPEFFGRSDSSESSEEDNMDESYGIGSSWSITWYIASFSILIVFFVIISCSEWCCRKRPRSQRQQDIRTAAASLSSSQVTTQTDSFQELSSPPAYDLFAPPSYDSLAGAAARSSISLEKSEYDVYVVPVHAINNVFEPEGASAPSPIGDEPPSYSAVHSSPPDQTSLEDNLNANIARHLNAS